MEAHHTEKHKLRVRVRDVIIGMSDGLTVPFALAAGLSGTAVHPSVIIIAGLAEIAAGSISMGLGGYLAAQSDADVYHNELVREQREVIDMPEKEKEEVAEIFRAYGLSDTEISPVLDKFEKEPAMWVKFMMAHELFLHEPDPKQAVKSAGTIALSYVVGGIIPLSPYFFTQYPHQGLIISIGITLTALVAFGYIKSRYVGIDPWKGALRTAVVGAIAAGAAFFLARLIS